MKMIHATYILAQLLELCWEAQFEMKREYGILMWIMLSGTRSHDRESSFTQFLCHSSLLDSTRVISLSNFGYTTVGQTIDYCI